MSPVCQCLLNPSWSPAQPFSDIKINLPPFDFPKTPLNNGLTDDEKAVLGNLLNSWDSFISLGKSTEDDIQEFRDAIHRCQQLIALRVARRVNPEVWRQPTET